MIPELEQIEILIAEMGPKVRSKILAHSQMGDIRLPIYKLTFGSEDPCAPTIGFIGGVHGLERIGAQVCLSLLKSFAELMLWDEGTKKALQNIRVFFIPVVNPIGILKRTRSNPQGVDLMRNSPTEADAAARWVGGQRYSAKLPWYRGDIGQAMQPESMALVAAVEEEIFKSKTAITLDFHSGFGWQDQIWFPYAKTKKPYPGLPEAHAFKTLFDRTYPHHFYKIEPQALNYTTHGDLWDHLYDEYLQRGPRGGNYLPLCVEMGSWTWLKKNPLQIFRLHGHFNPLKSHRMKRTLRRHNTLFDFMIKAAQSPQAWAQLSESQKIQHTNRAKELWYV
ncbi:MAG: DUF2817 domain-containing protein [Bdellovibrionaceae bacterium]|nr:DUF2817 domain-containing protein [Pseudobdellovibrionaceae bacterium]